MRVHRWLHFVSEGQHFHSFPPNACRGERCGVWGRIAPIRPVLSANQGIQELHLSVKLRAGKGSRFNKAKVISMFPGENGARSQSERVFSPHDVHLAARPTPDLPRLPSGQIFPFGSREMSS